MVTGRTEQSAVGPSALFANAQHSFSLGFRLCRRPPPLLLLRPSLSSNLHYLKEGGSCSGFQTTFNIWRLCLSVCVTRVNSHETEMYYTAFDGNVLM